MKKYSLAFGLMLLMAVPAFAQGKKKAATTPKQVTVSKKANVSADPVVATPMAADVLSMPAEGTPTGTLTVDNMQFESENHNFGNVAEGPTADYTFTFVNTGKEPIVIQRVQPACGCTAADWSKEPIMPGQKGFAKAVYNTQGRPGPFNKTVTVLTNAGAKVLSFMGEVEKAPASSVPANNSMMKTQ
jgi:hypothetical protein